MNDAQDVRARVSQAWREAAQRAYEAANGVVDERPDDEPQRWRWRWHPRVAITAGVLLAVVAGVAAWWPHTAASSLAPPAAAPAGEAPGGAQASTGPSAAIEGVENPFGGDATVLTVHVAGAVTSPGVYEMPPGSRVADAIDAAGGALDPSDLDALNLAKPLADGERVAVGRDQAEGSGPVNLNTATEERLTELPGVGPVLASRIVAYRESHGPFVTVEDLEAVPGVGPSVLAGLRDVATV